jgi:ABC-2 type transport system permease protein
MQKYLVYFGVRVQENLAYRLNFILWRVRNVFTLLFLYFLWVNVLKVNTHIQGYTEPLIFTYLFLANFLNAVVLSTKTDQVAGDILNGNIINQLLKPISFFGIVGTRELVDKIINILFSIVEVSLFLLVFHPPIFIQSNPLNLLVFLFFVILALLISFFISFGLSMIAFWTTEIWAPRFIFMVLISMIAGTIFPLDILPPALYNIFMWTPFPYLVYVPVKVFLFGVTPQTVQFAVIGLIWLCLSYSCSLILWKKGIKSFSFFGR